MSETKFKFDYIKNRKIYFIISGIIVIFSILSTFIFGAKLDIQLSPIFMREISTVMLLRLTQKRLWAAFR